MSRAVIAILFAVALLAAAANYLPRLTKAKARASVGRLCTKGAPRWFCVQR